MKKKKISLSIAEDHPYFSNGVANALAVSDQYDILGFIENATDIIRHINKHKPEILILDINLSGQNTLELLPAIKKIQPSLKILILSMYHPNEVNFDAYEKFIDAYVLKNSGAEILQIALNAVMSNKHYTDPNVKKVALLSKDKFINKIKLSSREVEILELLKRGLSNKAIAEKLFISELTVKTHRKNIMQKMESRNFADLIRKT